MRRKFTQTDNGNGFQVKDFQMQQRLTHQESVAEQDTIPLPAIHKSAFFYRLLPGFVQRLTAMMLMRVKESEPEAWSNTLHQKAMKSQARVLGWLPILALTNALGIFLTAYACVYSIHTSADQEVYLWLGLLVIFAPSFLRLLSPIASRLERIGIICSAGLSIYLVPKILSPLHFVFVDEYMHWRTVDDIVRSGHLFSENSILSVSPLYPGLEIVTDAFSSMSGLSTSNAGLIVVGVARIVIILSLFMLFEQVTKSSRTAGIATILYMANTGFFMFDSLFLYESLGLAIGVFMLFTLARMETMGNGKHMLLLSVWIALAALTTTHHVSDFYFVGLLVLWVVVQKFLRKPVLHSNVAKTALFGILLTVIWVVFVARPVIRYLSGPITASITELVGVVTGTGNVRHFFIDHTAGHATPLWQQLTMLSSVGLITLAVPFAFLCIWHRYRYNPLPFMLGIVSLIYIFTQALRFTSVNANIADRSSPYIFIAISFALAILITQMWPARMLKWRQMIFITFMVSLVFLGGSMLGSGPSWTLMPSGYVVGDDSRSVSLEGIQSATWTLQYLGPNNRISTDTTNSLLFESYGDQRIVTISTDKVDVAPVFYATALTSWQIAILQSARVHYLVVDLRLSTALPEKGNYFGGEESPDLNLTTPISQQALTKFDTVPQINRVFDSGAIVIYDVGGFINAPKKP